MCRLCSECRCLTSSSSESMRPTTQSECIAEKQISEEWKRLKTEKKDSSSRQSKRSKKPNRVKKNNRETRWNDEQVIMQAKPYTLQIVDPRAMLMWSIKRGKSQQTNVNLSRVRREWEKSGNFYFYCHHHFFSKNFTMVELSQAIRRLMLLLIYSQFGRIKIIKADALHILRCLSCRCVLDEWWIFCRRWGRVVFAAEQRQWHDLRAKLVPIVHCYLKQEFYVNNEAIY